MSADKSRLVKFPHDLTVRWLTYTNESAGLLDFEHKNFNRHYLNVRKGLYAPELFLVGDGPYCRILPNQDKTLAFLQANSSCNVLVKISCEEGKLYVSSPDPSVFDINEKVLRLISEKACRRVFGHFKSTNALPIALKEGDEIRLGRVKLVVRHLAFNSSLPLSYLHELISDSEEQENAVLTVNNPTGENSNDRNNSVISQVETNTPVNTLNLTLMDNDPLVSSHQTAVDLVTPPGDKAAQCKHLAPEEAETFCDISTTRTNLTTETIAKADENVDNTCRICLCSDDCSGPLITPCSCRGSLTYVHLNCIRSWIKGRLNCYVEGMPNKSYFWQKLTCELCGTMYPNKISIDNTEHDFVDIEQPKPPYMVLEPENVTEKGYFIVSLANSHAVIGRGHQSDIRLTDISVSRTHSVLYFNNNHFIIQDKRSKFGTIINSSQDSGFKAQLSLNNPVLLKIGNGILSISIKRPFRPFFCINSYPQQATTFSL